jgi:hypothetical protein
MKGINWKQPDLVSKQAATEALRRLGENLADIGIERSKSTEGNNSHRRSSGDDRPHFKYPTKQGYREAQIMRMKYNKSKKEPQLFAVCYLGMRENTIPMEAKIKDHEFLYNPKIHYQLEKKKYKEVGEFIKNMFLEKVAPNLRDKFRPNSPQAAIHYKKFNHELEPWAPYHHFFLSWEESKQCRLWCVAIDFTEANKGNFYNFACYRRRPAKYIKTFERVQNKDQFLVKIDALRAHASHVPIDSAPSSPTMEVV